VTFDVKEDDDNIAEIEADKMVLQGTALVFLDAEDLVVAVYKKFDSAADIHVRTRTKRKRWLW
jgi:hypothetical protein